MGKAQAKVSLEVFPSQQLALFPPGSITHTRPLFLACPHTGALRVQGPADRGGLAPVCSPTAWHGAMWGGIWAEPRGGSPHTHVDPGSFLRKDAWLFGINNHLFLVRAPPARNHDQLWPFSGAIFHP